MYIFFGSKIEKKETFELLTKNLFHFTYTTYPISFGKTKINNDVGWGCAIRSYQMMLSYVLNKIKDKNEILSLLYKYDGYLSLPVFIKELNNKSYKEGKYLGSYLISNIYSNLLKKNKIIDVFITENNIIDIEHLNFNKFTLLTFSIRFGITSIGKHKNYILNCFNCKQFGGFIGGVGVSSYYFFAKDDKENLYYIDPHKILEYNTEHNDIKNINKFLVKNYSCININKINPSITFSFYYNNYNEFLELKKFLEKYTLFNILNIKDDKNYKCKNNSKDDWQVVF